MTRSSENRCFRRFQQTRDPRLLGKVFDGTAAELLRVAGHLANGDRDLTQDALQATFLTAIEDAHSYDPTRDVRPWLLGILANHVRKERRRTRRHRGEDVTTTALSVDGSQLDDVQRAEVSSTVRAAIERVPSPFREALDLHLHHGLTASEIGQALGRPAGTVRTQIVRGMDRLRALLPAGLTASALGMLLTPRPVLAAVRQKVLSTIPSAATTSSSLVLSSWRLYAMIAGSVTLVLSVLVSLWMGGPDNPPGGALSLPPQGLSQQVEQVVAPVKRDVVAVAAPDVAPAPWAPPQDPPLPKDLQSVEVEVVYADDTPAIDVPVVVRVGGVWRRWHTDDRGHAALVLPWPGLHEFYVYGTPHQSHLSWSVDGLLRPKKIKKRIVLPLGMQLHVTVLDADGAPIPNAAIDCSNGYSPGGPMLKPLGRTDASGQFVRNHVGAGGHLRVWADGYLPSKMVESNGTIGATTHKTITLAKGALRAEGIVTDETGKPIANANLALVQLKGSPSQPQFFQSREDGSFDLHTLKPGAHIVVGIHNEGVVRRGQVRFRHDGVGTVSVRLRMTQGARVVGRLTDEEGTPLISTNVVARDRPEAISRLPFLEAWTSSAPDGSFQLEGLASGTYQLESDNMPSLVVTLTEGQTFSWQPVRVPLQPVLFRILDPLGEPLNGWMVFAMPPGQDWPTGGQGVGADGRIPPTALPTVYPSGTHVRLAIHKGLGREGRGLFDFAKTPSLVTPPLVVGIEHEIRVPAHALDLHSISGKIVDARGRAVAEADVVLTYAIGSFRALTATTDAAGRFELEDVAPGPFRVSIKAASAPQLHLPHLHVRGEETLSLGRIVIPDQGILAVKLPPGAAANGFKLSLLQDTGRRSWLRKGEDDQWRSNKLFVGNYRLEGWSRTSRVVSQQVTIGKEPVVIEPEVAPYQASKIVVKLPHEHPRNAAIWSGTLTGKRDGQTVIEHRLGRRFEGTFHGTMEFAVFLPEGELKITVSNQFGYTGDATLRVPPQGGGRATVHLR